MNHDNKNNIKNQETKIDILEKCTDKRLKNPKFSDYIKSLTTKKNIERIKDCGIFLELLGDFEMENRKINKANFCGNRFCPMCSWRLACKDSLEISILMEHLRCEENKEFIFLTLTTPNVKGDSLEEELLTKKKKKQRKKKKSKQLPFSPIGIKSPVTKILTITPKRQLGKRIPHRKKQFSPSS